MTSKSTHSRLQFLSRFVMTTLALVLCLAVAVSGRTAYFDDASSRIVGGEKSERGDWPWQVSLEMYYEKNDIWYHGCGASILSESWILTAAHCVDGKGASEMRVVVGEHDRSGSSVGSEKTHSVEKVIMHEDYQTKGGYPNDIALIWLDTPIDFTSEYAQTIDLAPEWANFDGQKCHLTGWGRTGGSEAPAIVLKQVEMTVITTNECSYRWTQWPRRSSPITSKQICAYDPGLSACMGDSGGPMSCRLYETGPYVLAGVTSWGTTTCTEKPSVYTRVSSHRQWINEHSGL